MRIGIGLPNTMQTVDRASIVSWARTAEGAGFSSVAVFDRLAFINYEPLISLSAAAAVTERVELVTDIVLAPLHVNAAMLAKQAATLDQLSQGRLVLGLGVGGVAEDFEVSNLDYHTRGRTFEDQLKHLRTQYQGELVGATSGEPVGPFPYGGRRLPILIGGTADPAFRRAAEYGDGWISADLPDGFIEGVAKMRTAWTDAGREGQPRFVASQYFALGEAGLRVTDENVRRFYNAADANYGNWVVESVARGEDAVLQQIAAFAQAGADDLICVPTSTEPAEIERLASIAL